MCRKNTESKNLKQKKEKQCFHQNVWCVFMKKLRFIIDQETSRLISSLLHVKTLIIGFPIVCPILF